VRTTPPVLSPQVMYPMGAGPVHVRLVPRPSWSASADIVESLLAVRARPNGPGNHRRSSGGLSSFSPEDHRPSDRPMTSFMISVVPP
jgi:hypothetical protein